MIHHVQLACPPGSEDTLRGFPGMRHFYSEAPHGNRLEFLEPTDNS